MQPSGSGLLAERPAGLPSQGLAPSHGAKQPWTWAARPVVRCFLGRARGGQQAQEDAGTLAFQTLGRHSYRVQGGKGTFQI